MLVARGLDPGKDLQRTVTKKFDDIVLAVKAGVFDAGFIRDGVIEDMVAKQRLAPGDVIVVEAQPAEAGYTHARTTPFYPEWYLLATKGSQDLAKTIAALCLAMPADHPALAKTEASGWVAPADLSPTLDVLRLLKQAPFDH